MIAMLLFGVDYVLTEYVHLVAASVCSHRLGVKNGAK